MKVYSRLVSCVSLLALLAPTLVSAQANPSTNTPPGVSFTIRFKGGKTSFYQGELITIEMLFTSTIPDTYQLSGATYDRSGRFEADAFHVEPANGIVDPTAEYFHNALFGFMGGGLQPGPIILSEKPYVISRDINELVRFDQPGHYRLFVTNTRIGKIISARMRKLEPISAASNTIEFDILPPDAKWQEQTIRDAAQAIKEKGSEARDACRTLRFMNSAAAEAEMIRLFPSGCFGEFTLGLVGSPRRSALIDAMETQIAGPDYPVTGAFIHALSAMALLNEHPEPLPAYVPDDPEKIKQLQAAAQNKRNGFQEIVTRYLRQMTATVSRKTRGARAATLNTLLEFDASTRTQKPTSDNLAVDQLVASLPDLFLELPYDRQYSLLTNYWKRLPPTAMLPVLRQLIAQPATPRNDSNGLRSVALKRLYQLSPEEGRAMILREMKVHPQRVGANVLQILPDAELPEVDQMVAEALEKAPAGDSLSVLDEFRDLIARYAGANSLTRVKTASGDKIGKMACALQSSLLVYFLRVDPDYGAAQLEQALAARGQNDTGCYRMTFDDIGRRFMSPMVEDIAIKHLDDSDRNVAIQAIILLRQKASPKAAKPLMDRLERWHEQWRTREAEVQPQIENGMVAGEPMQLELELVRALVSGSAWTLDADQLKHVQQLCLTPNARAEVELATKLLDDRQIHISLSSSDEFPMSITLGTYHTASIDELKSRLSTMPKESHFVLDCSSQDAEAEALLFEELKSFLAEHGMTLERSERIKQ